MLTFTDKFFFFNDYFIVDTEVETGFQEKSKAQKYLCFISRRNFAKQRRNASI